MNQKGIRLPVCSQECVSFPDAWASDGQNVVEDIFRGSKRRCFANAGYDVLAYFSMMYAPRPYIYNDTVSRQRQQGMADA